MNKKTKTNDKLQRANQEEIKDALLRSGYFLEQRAKEIFMKHGFVGFGNTSIVDPISKKSREIDFEAHLDVIAIPELDMTIKLILVAECKNKYQPLVFIKEPTSDNEPFGGQHFQISCSPGYFVDEETNTSRPSIDESDCKLSLANHNWIITGQFCTFKYSQDIDGWNATGDEDDFLSLTKLLYAMRQRESTFGKSITYNKFGITIFQPLLILQDDFFVAYQNDGEVVLKSENHLIFNLEQSYSHDTGGNSRSKNSIHVVAESHLNEYALRIRRQLGEFAYLMNNKTEYFQKEFNLRYKR